MTTPFVVEMQPPGGIPWDTSSKSDMPTSAEWVSVQEAASMTGLASPGVPTIAKRHGWRRATVKQGFSRHRVFYAKEDVLSYNAPNNTGRTAAFMAMKDWMDSLPFGYWPTTKNMAKHVIAPFGMRDMEGLFETRKYREKARVNRPHVGLPENKEAADGR